MLALKKKNQFTKAKVQKCFDNLTGFGFQELKEQIPKEQAELERLSALHQQKQLEQQQASTDIKRKSQLASEMDIKQKIAADLQRIR